MSPVPTFIKICKAKSVQDFKPDPYVVTILNCAMWSFYGMPFISKSNTLVLTINGFGFFIEIIYTSIFFVYSNGSKRKKILLALLAEVVFLVLVVFIVMYFVTNLKERRFIVGVICIIFNILMYFSPLTVMRQVIRSKSVKYMPFLLSLANFANGLIWTTYALLRWDPFVVIPNGLGALSGLAQLILYAVYYRTTKWDDDAPPSSVNNV
ncbi:putative SWEET sugar transporter [Medicago truncatula]|uniref:Putative SWEET sugar transporter n=1 Tax=Medicago truncatula TaxID=3880 RepID=A0A396IGY9_MEDTR|nr:bidirectional sugar transporter SWEET5 [Medicago truncatula]RHN63524.1 putative SWEET sugar transporter [Medicago truncatula]